MNLILIIFSFFLLSFNAYASNTQRESRLVAEIEDAIMDGDGFWLDTGKTKFFSIFTEADEPKANVILLHGRGLHADWTEVIAPLRVGLAEQGFNTLSLQLPVLNKGSKYNQYVPVFGEALPRIESAIKYLKANSNKPIVLLAHSCGAHMATEWIFINNKFPLDAYIGISQGATDYMQPMQRPFPYALIKTPVLDIYGSNDTASVIHEAGFRQSLFQSVGNPKSKQILIDGADHYYHEKGDILTEKVSGWLKSIFK